MVVAGISFILVLSAVLSVWHAAKLYVSLTRSRIALGNAREDLFPAVSVCIPARNETHALAECLEKVLASDYKKLEILVFDDDSKDDTSVIIRSFAHAGVRFVPGTELPEGWLGKNHALNVLANEASGTFVIFMDVDTKISPDSIRHIVTAALNTKASMVSVLPGRSDILRPSVLFGHLRYFWELSLASDKRPATSSSLWMIDRSVLLGELGGFESFRSIPSPESAMASTIGPGRYRSFVTDSTAEVTYEKKWRSQVETSKRLLYPRANGTKSGALVAFMSLLLLNVPMFTILSGFVSGWTLLQYLAVISLFAGSFTYGMYTISMWRRLWWFGIVVWPVVIFQELLLFINSFQGYYRNTITWKGRPVSPHPRLTAIQ